MAYPGGKAGSGVYQTIINLMAPHDVYIEPFLGGGAVMRAKRPARLNLGLDLVASAVQAVAAAIGVNGDGDVHIVQSGEFAGGIAESGSTDGSGESRSHSAGIGVGRVTAEKVVPAGNIDGIPSAERAGRAIAGIGDSGDSGSTLAQPGGTSRNGGAVRIAKSADTRRVSAGLAMRSREWGPTGQNGVGISYRLECRDALEFLEGYQPEGATVIYCDPPYLRSTRKGGRLYEHEMSDVDHLRLLRACRELAAKKCHILMSGYSSPMYAKELKGWNATAYQAGTRRGGVAEWIWYNFPRPTELHDYRFLGDNFRERERIRRQQRRWRAKLNRMDVLQRQALLSVLSELHV